MVPSSADIKIPYTEWPVKSQLLRAGDSFVISARVDRSERSAIMKRRSDYADVESRQANLITEPPTFESLNSQLDTYLKFASTAQSECAAGYRESAEHSDVKADQGLER